MATQIGVKHSFTDASEADSPELSTCPQCKTQAVPRKLTSTMKSSEAGVGHCPYCGHVYGRNSLLVRKVRHIDVTGAGGASTITVDGGTLKCSAAILPDYADNQAVTWSIVDGTAVGTTVDQTGLVTAGAGAAANGTATVVATANDGSGVKGELVITVSNQV